MSESSFPVNDLFRRKLQTLLVTLVLASSVSSTVFLLLLSSRVGFGVSLIVEGRLTAGLSSVFSPFIMLLIVLVLITEVVTTSFMVSMMMSQRMRDIGLMKAAGCPNDLIFGYFSTELLIVVFLGCMSGALFGSLADLASRSAFGALGSYLSQAPFNFWLVLLVFVLFFFLALVSGLKPILDASRTEPVNAMSPTFCLGLTKESRSKVLPKRAFVIRLASRSLIRHRSATVKVFICLSLVFTLMTIGVAGGLIGELTTKRWVEKAMGRNVVVIGHHEMCDQYTRLLNGFFAGSMDFEFDYANEQYVIPANFLERLHALYEDRILDTRLVFTSSAREIQGIIYGNGTDETKIIGDNRQEQCVLVGVDPSNLISNWFLDGRFLNSHDILAAVIGDTLAKRIFSDPLAQRMKILNKTFDIVGVCVEPLNNGKVVYVPLQTLQNLAEMPNPSLILMEIDETENHAETIDRLVSIVQTENPQFTAVELDSTLNESLNFLGSLWFSVMLVPLFLLVAASLCVLGYVTLAIDEQRQEFGVLRAVGAKPSMILKTVFAQGLILLLSSCLIGIAFGVIVTLIILVQEPVVTAFVIFEIGGLLATALLVTTVSILFPAIRFSRKPILELIG